MSSQDSLRTDNNLFLMPLVKIFSCLLFYPKMDFEYFKPFLSYKYQSAHKIDCEGWAIFLNDGYIGSSLLSCHSPSAP